MKNSFIGSRVSITDILRVRLATVSIDSSLAASSKVNWGTFVMMMSSCLHIFRLLCLEIVEDGCLQRDIGAEGLLGTWDLMQVWVSRSLGCFG